MLPLASIADPKVAAHLLDPLRARILALAREPHSASQFAERVGLPRQRVNYHVKQLRNAGLLVETGRRDRRNLTEVLYGASARAYLVDAKALGALAPEPGAQTGSAEQLAAIAARTQSEVGQLIAEAPPGAKPGVIAVDVEVRVGTGAERDAFARALDAAIASVAERHASPRGTAHRLVAGVHARP